MDGYNNDSALREERCIQSVNIPQQNEKLLVEQHQMHDVQKKINSIISERALFSSKPSAAV